MSERNEIAIIGAGIGGLTLGLALQARGVPCRIYERSESIKPLGVGINILPHATRILDGLGLTSALGDVAVEARETAFFNRFGQLIYSEPLGRGAGYATPQFSIHRGDLQAVLLDAFVERAGADRVIADTACRAVEQSGDVVTIHLERTSTGQASPDVEASVAIACDGLHSVVRKQLHPNEGEPKYLGVNMWRGVTAHRPILSGATMIRTGWLKTGKMVIYPIRNDIDDAGRQLVNWVAELETPRLQGKRDWNREGRLEDFLPAFEEQQFDWLDVPALIRGAEMVLELPMLDQDPLPFWGGGRVTLLGDAAHPMVPRGSNGAAQAILDADSLANELARGGDPVSALMAYEDDRLEATARVVLTNRVAPPDIILKEIYDRTGDRPFDDIADVISETELAELHGRYKQIAGYDIDTLRARATAPG